MPKFVVNIYSKEGETTLKQDETRQKLIDGTIHVIARDGLDKATTKQIGNDTAINEVYIYRCFSDKEDMFSKTFDSLDEELVTVAMKNVCIMYMNELEFETRCRLFYSAVWRFILRNSDKCLAYIRYYYSTYFKKNSARSHKERFVPLIEKFKGAFRDESNVWMIFNHMLMTVLDFAVRVFDGSVPDNDDTEEHVFRLIYYSAQQYFKAKEC